MYNTNTKHTIYIYIYICTAFIVMYYMSPIKMCSGEQYSLECLSNYLSNITCSLTSRLSLWAMNRPTGCISALMSENTALNHNHTSVKSRTYYQAVVSMLVCGKWLCFCVANTMIAHWRWENSRYCASWIYHRMWLSPMWTDTRSPSIPVTMATTSPSY